MTHLRCGAMVLAAVGWLEIGTLALAQDAEPAPTPAEADATQKPAVIEEIFVTAERREARVEDTPIAISAFSEADLDSKSIWHTEDLQFHVPNLYYTEGGPAPPITQIAVRGVGMENVTAGGDPGVAYHIDGVYLARPASAAADFNDLERVEVLRGPQGTLYGRNATGGAINVITKKPSSELEASADVLFGDYDALRIRAAVGGPIIEDRVLGRVSLISDQHDGYMRNLATRDQCFHCEDLDQKDILAGRLHLNILPAENVDVLLTAQIFESKEARATKIDGAFSDQVELAPGFFIDPYDSALPNPSSARKARKDGPEGLDLESKLFSAHLNWDLESISLSSVTSFQSLDWKRSGDNDHSELFINYLIWDERSEQWVQEVQLASNDWNNLNWVAGVFYLHEEIDVSFIFRDVNVFTFQEDSDFETNSYAFFGNLWYDANDAFGLPITIHGGLRWTKDDKKEDDLLAVGPGTGAQPPQVPINSGKEWSEVTGEVGIDYALSDATMLYAKASRGYKAGGFASGAQLYDPEYVWAYEVGAKTNVFDRRLSVNLAYFYNDYEDLQVFLLETQASRIDNAAQATIQGIEIETIAIPFDNLTLNANFSWLDATYDKYDSVDPRDPAAGLQDLSGNRVNRAPEFQLGLGAQYAVDMGSSGSFTPRVDFYWQDETFFKPFALSQDKAGAFHRTDLKLTWQSPKSDWGSWWAEVLVRNLEDNDVIQNIEQGSATVGFPVVATYFPPRTWGVTIGWKY